MPAHTDSDKSGTIGEGKPQADTETSAAANEVDGAYADGPALPRTAKVVLVMDLVESVRLMAQDESGVVARWHGFTKKAAKLIPRHRGRIVKSLGDGLLAEFDHSRDAVQVATALHKMIQPANQGRGQDQQLWLRVGINATPVYVDSIDIYGSGVNLAARLAGLAGPGETIASASVRDQLTDGLDADVEDMGECYLKHVEEPVRAYRIGPPGPRPVLMPEKEYNTPLQPTIAVIPFTSRSNAPEHFAIGELIADGVIGQLSRTPDVRVISRLSCTAFRGRDASVIDISTHLNATYVLTGNYTGSGTKLLISAELADAKNNEVVWAHRISGSVGDLMESESLLISSIAMGAHKQVMNAEVQKAVMHPLPSLESCTLMLGSITLMHRLSLPDFKRAGDMLELLVNRHPRYVAPKAWLARWHNLCVAQGWSLEPSSNSQKSVALLNRALDIEPTNAFALTVRALIHGYSEKRFDLAKACYESALDTNPNEPLAWIGLATLSTWSGDEERATQAIEQALALSPLDPMKYYFDSMAATVFEGVGELDKAITFASRAIRLNRNFFSSHLAAFFAEARLGHRTRANTHARIAMQLRPQFSVEQYRRSSPNFLSPRGNIHVELLESFGFPV